MTAGERLCKTITIPFTFEERAKNTAGRWLAWPVCLCSTTIISSLMAFCLWKLKQPQAKPFSSHWKGEKKEKKSSCCCEKGKNMRTILHYKERKRASILRDTSPKRHAVARWIFNAACYLCEREWARNPRVRMVSRRVPRGSGKTPALMPLLSAPQDPWLLHSDTQPPPFAFYFIVSHRILLSLPLSPPGDFSKISGPIIENLSEKKKKQKTKRLAKTN